MKGVAEMFNKTFVIVIAILFTFGINGLSFAAMCEHMNLAQVQQQEEALETQEAINVGNKICPVSGEKIDENTKATYEYQGKIYNFCCPMCIEEFKKDPEKYIKKVEEGLQTESNVGESEMGMQESGVSQQGTPEGHQH